MPISQHFGYFDPAFNSTQIEQIKNALSIIEDDTCLRFREMRYAGEFNDYLYLVRYRENDFVCLSHIGRITGRQPIYTTLFCACGICVLDVLI